MLSLQDLGDDLLFFNQKSSDNAIAHALRGQRATICAVDGLKASRHSGPFSGSRWHNTVKLLLGLTASRERWSLLQVLVGESAARSLDYSSLVGGGVVRQTSS